MSTAYYQLIEAGQPPRFIRHVLRAGMDVYGECLATVSGLRVATPRQEMSPAEADRLGIDASEMDNPMIFACCTVGIEIHDGISQTAEGRPSLRSVRIDRELADAMFANTPLHFVTLRFVTITVEGSVVSITRDPKTRISFYPKEVPIPLPGQPPAAEVVKQALTEVAESRAPEGAGTT